MAARDEAWYRAVVESLPHYLWVGEPGGTLTYVDPRLYPLLGMSPSEEAGNAWLERIHPDERDKAIATWKLALEFADEFRIEYRLQCGDGAYRWFAARARPELGPDNRPVRWVGTLDDIHADMATRKQLEFEQLRLAKMAAASPQMLYSFWSAPDGRAAFPYASPAFLKLFELDAAELAQDASSFFRLGNPEDAPAVTASVLESARDLSHWRQQWRSTAPKHGELWLEAHAMPVREPDGSTTWHGMVSDITERRRQEQELRELNTRLEQRVAERTLELELANRELEAFSYSVSHDLREPLRAVNGFSQAVLEDYAALLPPEGQKYLGAIRQGALRMGQLIDDLLAFSRLGRHPLVRRPVDVRGIVDECVRALVAAEGEKARVSIGELAPCEADAALLQQVFANLLSNAFKYSRKRETPEIDVLSTRDENGRAVYSVRDNGTGFDMKYAGKLFQVFQRLHRTAEFEGTGVGLAIVHRVVTRHGGRIWFDSAPDRGATFFFTIEA
ncbi:MAG TPA: PAS domain-containing protein [Polyangiaceae bacterium]